MLRIIKRKLYETGGSLLIHKWDNGIHSEDFEYCKETLYKTKNGQYFVAGEGGVMSKYGSKNGLDGGSEMKLITEDEALTWLEEHRGEQVLIKDFGNFIELG
ncbi:unnamed protein product [marine sediment metagenome]|uniref:Uncharacterized protein n=1 Tax=marine sediment metagenome TaxID=412755 RepID=X1E7C1_9ZZZZ